MDQFGLLPVGSALVRSRQFSRNQNVLMKYSRFRQNSSEGTPIRLTRRYTDITSRLRNDERMEKVCWALGRGFREV
ncbi:myosin ie [Moniliophthora roreri]|nr:myosin ie [Moniliophthora roreri]